MWSGWYGLLTYNMLSLSLFLSLALPTSLPRQSVVSQEQMVYDEEKDSSSIISERKQSEGQAGGCEFFFDKHVDKLLLS